MAIKKIPLLNTQPLNDATNKEGSSQQPSTTPTGPQMVSKPRFAKSKEDINQAPLTEELAFEALKQVNDPELPVDIVSLGLIYDVIIAEDNDVHIKMTLTTPGCSMGRHIAMQVEQALQDAGANDVLVEIIWDPPWNPEMVSDEAKQRLGIA